MVSLSNAAASDRLQREYVKWYSPYVQREMEMLVFGHSGARVLIFPARMGRFYEYEDWGLVRALEEPLQQGWLQLFCVDSIDTESLYRLDACASVRLQRHIQYEAYILHEVIPFTARKNDSPYLISHGCSLGAFHAVNIAFRHPLYFSKVVALSGRYDLTQPVEDFAALLGGCPDPTVYYHTPSHFIPLMRDPELLSQLRQLEIVLAIGLADPFLENNRQFSHSLWEKGIHHSLYEWEGRAHSAKYWRQMVKLYL